MVLFQRLRADRGSAIFRSWLPRATLAGDPGEAGRNTGRVTMAKPGNSESFSPICHWLGLSYVALPHCRGLETLFIDVPRKERRNSDIANHQHSLPQGLCTYRSLCREHSSPHHLPPSHHSALNSLKQNCSCKEVLPTDHCSILYHFSLYLHSSKHILKSSNVFICCSSVTWLCLLSIKRAGSCPGACGILVP